MLRTDIAYVAISTEYGIKTHKELNDFLRDAGAPEASLWQLHKYLDQTIFKRRKQEAITRRALLMSRHQWDGVIDPLESLEVDEAPAVGELSVPLLREVLAKDIHAPQKKIAACVDRSELRELFATSFIELFRAVGSLQRVIRSNLGRVLSAAKRVVFAKEDIAVRFLQSKVSFAIGNCVRDAMPSPDMSHRCGALSKALLGEGRSR